MYCFDHFSCYFDYVLSTTPQNSHSLLGNVLIFYIYRALFLSCSLIDPPPHSQCELRQKMGKCKKSTTNRKRCYWFKSKSSQKSLVFRCSEKEIDCAFSRSRKKVVGCISWAEVGSQAFIYLSRCRTFSLRIFFGGVVGEGEEGELTS